MTIEAYGLFGTLFDNDPLYSIITSVNVGWNEISLDDWQMNNPFVIAYEFNDSFGAAMDVSTTPYYALYRSDGGSWYFLEGGNFGIRANISYEGANVTYNVYRDGSIAVSGLTENSHTDTGLTNNTTYEYTISATYSDGEESEESDAVEVTPFADTVHEESHDDGSFESEFIAGSGNFSAVRYSAGSSGEDLVRFKWFQNGSGGAFYIKVFEDDGGMPGAEIFSAVQASGNVDGWNEKDLSSQGLNVSGDFWIGVKEFSSSKPFGLDTSSDSGNSYSRVGSSGDWTSVSGNLAYHVFLDCGDNCDDEGCTNAPGDVNEDDSISILDIIQVANHVLGSTTLSGCALEGADVNGDGSISILDIIGIVNIILGNRGIDATSAIMKKTGSALLINANGYVGGIQMTLEHDQDFSIKLTEDALFAKSVTEGNKTTMVIVVPTTDEMFVYSGDFEIVDVVVANSFQEIPLEMPKTFELSSAYPNPFNPSTSIGLNISNEGHVDVKVFDLSGRVVATLLSGNFSAGYHDMKWNASKQASGMYLVRAEMTGDVAMQKILLLK